MSFLFMLIFLITGCASTPAFFVEGEIFWSDDEISGSLMWFETQMKKPSKHMSEQPCRIEILNGQREACEECLLQADLYVEEQAESCEYEMVTTQNYRFRFEGTEQVDWYVEHSDGWKKWGVARTKDEQSLELEAQELFTAP